MALLRLAMAQMNPTVGDLEGNARKIKDFYVRASATGADVMVTPELAITGYPPEDLLLKDGFVDEVRQLVLGQQSYVTGTQLLVGTPWLVGDQDNVVPFADSRSSGAAGRKATPEKLANALIGLDGQNVRTHAYKRLLPNYDVFDEQRYFVAGGPGPTERVVTALRDSSASVAYLICEDVWEPDGPAAELAHFGAKVIVVVNASPFSRGRQHEREEMLAQRARETGCVMAYLNMVGGQDELVFDGRSFVVDASGAVIARAPAFVEDLLVVDIEVDADAGDANAGQHERPALTTDFEAELSPLEEVYRALVLGTRDYVNKNGFSSVVVNLSGGIDSSLVTLIAVDAVGADHVRVFAQPSRYSSKHSIADAYELAARCGIEIETIPIEPAHIALASSLSPSLGHAVEGLTDENLQSRLRGLILMAISNDSGAIVLTTGNKSELATGYSTLYGDTAGGFAVIKDVPKTLVYELCRWRNDQARTCGNDAPIPENVLEKAPSAELRADQRDDQTLPPYEVLDPILEKYVEGDRTVEQLIDDGFDAPLVWRIAQLVDRAEYKRRQMPPGVRITKKAFGKDRRMPITNAYVAAPR